MARVKPSAIIAEKSKTDIQFGLLRFMFACTVIASGITGLGLLISPSLVESIIGWPNDTPTISGIAGSVYLAFALLSLFGLREPVKFAPLLLLQLCYKSILVIVLLPMLLGSQPAPYVILLIVSSAFFIIGDLAAIPFRYIFGE